MPTRKLCVFLVLTSACLVAAGCPLGDADPPPTSSVSEPGWHLILRTANLADFTVNTEPNPGGGTDGPFSVDPREDARLSVEADHAELTANYALRLRWINALAGLTCRETFPDGRDIHLTRIRYSGSFKTPELSAMDLNKPDNGQSVQGLLLLYDGRNALWPADHFALEACWHWRLNAWNGPDYGKIQVFTTNLALHDTGLFLPHDTQWHAFEVIVNFSTQRWESIRIDGQTADISTIPIARVDRSAWSGDAGVTFLTTVESCPAWPGDPITHAFRWNTHFKDLKLEYWE